MCTSVFARSDFFLYISFEYQSCITSDIWGIDTTYWTNNVFIFIRKLSLIYTKVSNIFTVFIFAYVATPAVEKQSWTFCVLFNFTTLCLTPRPPTFTGFQLTIWVFWYYIYYCPININWNIFHILYRYIFKDLVIYISPSNMFCLFAIKSMYFSVILISLLLHGKFAYSINSLAISFSFSCW